MERNKWVHGHTEENAHCSLLGFVSDIPRAVSSYTTVSTIRFPSEWCPFDNICQ